MTDTERQIPTTSIRCLFLSLGYELSMAGQRPRVGASDRYSDVLGITQPWAFFAAMTFRSRIFGSKKGDGAYEESNGRATKYEQV